MEKEFVPYELAVKLKALGFDEPCLGLYYDDGKTSEFAHVSKKGRMTFLHNSDEPMRVTKVLYQQAFRWFREKYEIFGVITSEKDDNYYNTEFFGYSVYKLKVNAPLSIGLDLKENASYEEAELACLDKLIKIVESKEKK